jgi:hypothetical protein
VFRVEVVDGNPVRPVPADVAPPPHDGDDRGGDVTHDGVGDTGRGQVGLGLGLRLVAQLASRWGVSEGPAGKVVWAELNRTDRRR